MSDGSRQRENPTDLLVREIGSSFSLSDEMAGGSTLDILDEIGTARAFDEEWDACESWAVEQAGPAPIAAAPEEIRVLTPDAPSVGTFAASLREGNKDNSTVGVPRKIALRKSAIEWIGAEHVRVLDLFCGMGTMWAHCWRGFPYHGIDSNKVFSPRLCEIGDAAEWLRFHDLGDWTIFDCDAWGSPWEVVAEVIRGARQGRIAILATDGMMATYRRSGGADFLVRYLGLGETKTGRMDCLAGFSAHYDTAVRAFVSDLCRRSGRKLVACQAANNAGTANGHNGGTSYWFFGLEAA